MGNRTCWAAHIGGCGGKISREHVVSEGVLRIARRLHPALALVRIAWDQRVLPCAVGAATVRHLCRAHNSQLSPLDTEAARFMRFIVNAVEPTGLAARVAAISSGHQAIADDRFDGNILELWALKTCLNLFAARGDSAPPDSAARPSGRHIVEAVFKRAQPYPGYGLYQFTDPRERLPRGLVFTVGAVEVERTTQTGNVLRFPAYFVFNLGPLQVAVHANVTDLDEQDWATEVGRFWAAQGGRPPALYRPRRLTLTKRGAPGAAPCLFARAELEWTTDEQPSKDTA